MEKLILTDPLANPDENALRAALGKKHDLYLKFASVTGAKGIVLEWHYYNDGKSWLCKALHKKKLFSKNLKMPAFIFPNTTKIRRIPYIINREAVNFRKIGEYEQLRRADKRIIRTDSPVITVLYQTDGDSTFRLPRSGFKVDGYKIRGFSKTNRVLEKAHHS